MDIQEYINSGILEQYALGSLDEREEAAFLKMISIYPEVKKKLTEAEEALEKLALINAVSPPTDLKQKILLSLGFSEDKIDLENLPAISKYSNCQSWLSAVYHLIPNEPYEDISIQVLRHDAQIAQMLVIAKVGVPMEIHSDVAESFFILKGECICTVSGLTFKLAPGDFLDIPLHQEHDVKLLTPYVIAILQHRFV
ncbi:cupin domain-containing protein [Mucilaginibacter sp.]|uniref:cupin domain-containing protein n=1 Tax=Mucilaginibacter sp. TaxID=1882438 RepID=UPI00262AD637|nr:cupin domain-containing protein [Mucilaginibacter sp.]MDB4925172.1 hypothetical protein [Mucilaginibacter sp.]